MYISLKKPAETICEIIIHMNEYGCLIITIENYLALKLGNPFTNYSVLNSYPLNSR